MVPDLGEEKTLPGRFFNKTKPWKYGERTILSGFYKGPIWLSTEVRGDKPGTGQPGTRRLMETVGDHREGPTSSTGPSMSMK